MSNYNNTKINRIENNSIIEEYDTDYILYYDGSYYNGELKEIENNDCIRDGYGVMVYSDGITSYTGYYKDNLKHGRGKYVSIDGSSYEGEFLNGVRSGKGKFISNKENDSFIYEGEWENDVRSGKGNFISNKENKTLIYEGEWKNDLKHGSGKYSYKEKYNYDISNDNNIDFYEEEFEGTWVNDEKNGKGEMRIKGVWNDGNLLSMSEIEKRENIEEYIQNKINKNNNKNTHDWCEQSYYNMFPPGEVYEFY